MEASKVSVLPVESLTRFVTTAPVESLTTWLSAVSLVLLVSELNASTTVGVRTWPVAGSAIVCNP